ncbi:hypothetical protein FB451DRAFT_1497138 [Mycena latifolia]|nr:hypothetical protein FB451DRAFT_1497138 [Mycena latifolia]
MPEEFDILLVNSPQTRPLLSVCVPPLAGCSLSCEAKVETLMYVLFMMWPRFIKVAPASRRISARHRLHNVFTTSLPLCASFCTSLSMCLPAEEPAQEPAPPSTRPRASTSCPPCPCTRSRRRRPSETVVTVSAEEHTAAVSPYPYDPQPAQDAPAEPVAEANVPEQERVEIPQPRQWADEGWWDSRAVLMPVSEAVPAAATVA